MQINVHDSGSLGAVFCHYLLEEAGYSSDLIWSGEFLPSFLPAQVGPLAVNNGYHVFDYPRSAAIVSALESLSGLTARIAPKESWLFIAGTRIPSTSRLREWPDRVLRSVGLDPAEDFDEKVTANLDSFLRNFRTRFANDWLTVRHLFVPWFYPADYVDGGIDEGDVHRYRVRRKTIGGQIAYFGDGRMFSLRDALLGKLFPKIQEPPEYRDGKTSKLSEGPFGEGDRAFTLVIARLSPGRPSVFGDFDEVLVADRRIVALNRCWFTRIEHEDFVVCELFRITNDRADTSEVNILLEVLCEILGMSSSGVEFIGENVTRILNAKRLVESQLWNRNFQIDESEKGLEVRAVKLGTANMNKVWNKAVEATSVVPAMLERRMGE